MFGPLAFLFLIFPTGRPLSRRWGWLLRVMLVAYAVMMIAFALTPGPLEAGFAELPRPVANPIGLPSSWKPAIEAITTVAGLVVALRRTDLRRLPDPAVPTRRSARAATDQVAGLPRRLPRDRPRALLRPLLRPASSTTKASCRASRSSRFIIGMFLGIPTVCGIAILRHGLWDLDVVVKKTVQYGLLVAGFIAAVALLAVFLPVALIGLGGGDVVDVPMIVIGAVLAIGFILVRKRAQRWANRIVYGKRSTPYEVLSEFAERVGETYSTEDVLPRMAQLLGEATGARAARVWLRIGNEMRAEASWPPDVAPTRNLPVRDDDLPDFGGDDAFEVRHQGELLGALTVSLAANDPMNPTKAKLARDMAAQAGLVLRNVRLIEDLRESRRRIVSAQDERARALERNIHDGAQQQLVALSVKLRLASGLLERDPAKARTMLEELQGQTTETLEDLRDLARGIYPPLLADKGLPAALEAQARKSPVPVDRATRRRRPVRPGRGVGRVLLLSRGAQQRGEVRRRLLRRDPAASERWGAPFRGRRRRRGIRARRRRLTGPAFKGSPTAWTLSEAPWRSRAQPGAERHCAAPSRHGSRFRRPGKTGSVRRRRARRPTHLPAGRGRTPTWGCRRPRRTPPRAARTPLLRTWTGAERRHCSRCRKGSGGWRRGR